MCYFTEPLLHSQAADAGSFIHKLAELQNKLLIAHKRLFFCNNLQFQSSGMVECGIMSSSTACSNIDEHLNGRSALNEFTSRGSQSEEDRRGGCCACRVPACVRVVNKQLIGSHVDAKSVASTRAVS